MNWNINETWMIAWLSFVVFMLNLYPPDRHSTEGGGFGPALAVMFGALLMGVFILWGFNAIIFGINALGFEIDFNIRIIK